MKSKLRKTGQGVVVLDTLHLRERGALVLRGEFAELQRQLRWGQMPAGFKHDFRYEVVGDLRSYGLDVRLSINKKLGDANSKIEILDTGRKPLSAILETITAFRAGDPYSLEVMRADLCADTSAVSVPWCLHHLTIPYRRFQATGGGDWIMGKKAPQTIYFGVRPNMVRVYDKRAELESRYAKVLRALKNSSSEIKELIGDKATFENFAESQGYPDPPARFTRIERQCSGARVPAAAGTLRAIVKQLPEFNPFDGYRIAGGGGDPLSLTPLERVKAVGFVGVVQVQGLQFTRAQLYTASLKNYDRDWRWCEQYLPDDGCEGITPAQLREIFHESIGKQLRG